MGQKRRQEVGDRGQRATQERSDGEETGGGEGAF